MKKKICNICGINKLLTDYPKDNNLKTGYRGKCKDCSNQQCRKYYTKHKNEIQIRHKNYNSSPKRKQQVRDYIRHKRKNNTHFKLTDNLRRRINYAISSGKKNDHTIKLLGCSIEYFKKYIESLWSDGMNWGNYGMFGWHLDHIIPCANFDLSDEEQQKKCFHYTNIQPLWAKDNWSKGAK